MRIRTKLPLFTSVTVLFSIAAISFYTIYDFQNKTLESIESYKKEQTEIIKKQLQGNVKSAYDMIQQAHELTLTSGQSVTGGGGSISKSIILSQYLRISVENVRVMRFGSAGYIWLNEIAPPYSVIMHPTSPSLEGKDWYFEIPGTGQNIYEGIADVIHENGGEGFLEYEWSKPDSEALEPKLAYVKLYQPLGWVIGTGVYITHIDNMVNRKKAELDNQISKIIKFTVIFGIILVLIASVGLFFLGKTITDAIYKVRGQLFDMSNGILATKSTDVKNDEIGDMTGSLNELIDGVNSYSEFALNIGKGNLDADFSPLSEEDNLGNSLLDMRKSLKNARKEEEVRASESEKRNWASEGNALFSEIMRKSQDSIDAMAYDIISNLVKYLNANQGGLFLYNETNKKDVYLEMAASIAYDRRKFMQKIIRPGDGLVGTCLLEKKKIYITNVPDDYIEVRSGLGTSNPRCVLIVPLMMEGVVVGVIELASFVKFQEYEIEFIEKVSESIASSLYAASINAESSRLSKEFRTYSAEKKELDKLVRKQKDEIAKLRQELRLAKETDSVFSYL